MKLKEIKQYKNKNAYYGINEAGINIFVSYNTLIAVSVDNITFITDTYYSNTTAHHKTDAIRFYNNDTIIKVTSEALYQIAAENNNIKKQAILENKQKQILESFLKKLNKFDCVTEREIFINNTEFIKQETKNYKNGNKLKTRTYKTTFKTVPNFIITERIHIKKTTVQKFNGPKGPKGPYTYNQYKKKYIIKGGVNSS